MLECVILVGLQGAGKTTLYRQRFAASHAHVSMDLFPNARHKSARLLRELARALDDGRSVVVDNTNPTPEVQESAGWKEARVSDWTSRLQPHFRDHLRLVCRRYVRGTR